MPETTAPFLPEPNALENMLGQTTIPLELEQLDLFAQES